MLDVYIGLLYELEYVVGLKNLRRYVLPIWQFRFELSLVLLGKFLAFVVEVIVILKI